MSVENAPYIRGNLHYKPLSVHLTNALQTGVTYLSHEALKRKWTPEQVYWFSLILTIPAHLALISLVAIEVIFGVAAAAAAIVLNRVRYQFKNDSLEKHTLQFLSFSLHAVVNLVGTIPYHLTRKNKVSYLNNSFVSHFLHWFSAATVHYTIGPYFDQMHGRNKQLPMHRILNFYKDTQPYLMRELICSVRKDGFSISEDVAGRLEQSNFDDYFVRHPRTLTFLLELNIGRLFQDPYYASEAREHLLDLVVELQALNQPFFVLYQEEPASPEVQVYQAHLAELTKEAYREIWNTPKLWRCLGERDGQERLKVGLACGALWNYIIYKEVMTERDECPDAEREEALQEIETLIKDFTEDQHEKLKILLLKGNSEVQEGKVQGAFIKIGALGSNFHKFMKDGHENLFDEAFKSMAT